MSGIAERYGCCTSTICNVLHRVGFKPRHPGARKGSRGTFSGKRHSLAARKLISQAGKGRPSPRRGVSLSMETKLKISTALKGRSLPIETRRKMSLARRGEKNPNWRGGGTSFYPPEWTKELKESIRLRGSHVCQLCKKSALGYNANVHHIDYNKENCDPRNLILLCRSCNTKVNAGREFWTRHFRDHIVDQYPLSQRLALPDEDCLGAK